MTHLICYLSGVLSDSEAERLREAIAHFGLSQNWPIPRNEKTRIPFLKSDWCFIEPTPGAMLEEALRQCHDGSVFVIPSLAMLGERPSRQQSIILGLLSKGARVYVMELQGSVEPHLLALRTAWASARVMEQMQHGSAFRPWCPS